MPVLDQITRPAAPHTHSLARDRSITAKLITFISARLAGPCYIAIMEDRYVVRPTGTQDRWCVWDTHRNAVVFGANDIAERQAKEIADRLNDAYVRSQT